MWHQRILRAADSFIYVMTYPVATLTAMLTLGWAGHSLTGSVPATVIPAAAAYGLCSYAYMTADKRARQAAEHARAHA